MFLYFFYLHIYVLLKILYHKNRKDCINSAAFNKKYLNFLDCERCWYEINYGKIICIGYMTGNEDFFEIFYYT